MSQTPVANRIQELRGAVSTADPTAYLVEGRVMRRLLRKRSKHPSLAVVLPHGESQVVSAEDVFSTILPDELGLGSALGVTGDVILLQLPSVDQLEHWPLEDLKLLLWRRLFHAQLDRELNYLHDPQPLSSPRSIRSDRSNLTKPITCFATKCDCWFLIRESRLFVNG